MSCCDFMSAAYLFKKEIMRKQYHKLVRDAIPEIIQQLGGTCEVVTLTEEQYQQALREKLVEEAHEVAQVSNPQGLLVELADVYEVLDALVSIYGISIQAIQEEKERRRKERGGFQKRLYLLWSEEGKSGH